MSMLRLIAIRPLVGCCEHIRKCLKEGAFYFFCDRFFISDDGVITRNRNSRPLPENLFTINGSHPYINLTAIVGKNGDGKSSIVELMLRLINNYTATVEELTHDDVNPTVTIKGVRAELYFQIDATIYRLYDERGDGEVKLKRVASAYSGREVQMIYGGEEVTKSDELAGNFFYTMVSNFSHYAYNIYDFRREWVPISAKTDSDDTRCWLYYIFHKNDGYKSPLVLNPFRDRGNININNEAYLNSQRLISLFLDAEVPTAERSSFRRLEGKTAQYVSLKDPGESKLQQKTIVEHFMACRKDELLERSITLAREMGKDSKVLEVNKADCLQLLRQIQTMLIHSNESLLEEIKKWNNMVMKRAEGVYEDAGFLSEKSDFATWLDEIEKLSFGKDTENDEIERKRLIDGFRPYRVFNLAQLQMIALIRHVCDMMAGRDKSFIPGEDQFDLTPDVIAKPYENLTRREKCEHYIIYKIIDIFETYIDEYHKPCRHFKNSVIGNGEVAKDLVSSAVDYLWQNIKQSPSHSNLKLRQALNYLKNGQRDNGDVYTEINIKAGEVAVRVEDLMDRTIPPAERRERLVLPLDDLKATIADTKNLELMPPPIYQTDIVFVPDDNDEEVITIDTLSSGERQRLASLSCVIYHLRNLNSKKKEDVKYRNVNVVLEEIELYFHPECQRKFIKEMIEMIERAHLEEIDNINILFVTHSPFILSDIPRGNVMLLENGEQVKGERADRLKTFGANIFQMLDTGFFMERGAMGEFAKAYVGKVIMALNNWYHSKCGGMVENHIIQEYPQVSIRAMIDLIDDRIIRESLFERYEELSGESGYDHEITMLRKRLEYLENQKLKDDVVPPATD